MGVLRLIKELQAELMVCTELPHVVSVRLLARLDEAERHLGFDSAQPPVEAAQTASEATVLVEQIVADLDGGFSSGTPDATLELTEEK